MSKQQQPCESNDNLSDASIESNDHQYWGLSNARAGSGCGDADDAQDTIASTPTNDLATFLSCHGKSAEEIDGEGIERVDLKYDYEIHTKDDTDLETAVNTFEVDLLKAVADEYGLSSCMYGRRSLLRGGRKLDAESIVGVGSYPSDSIDPVIAECEVDVDFESPNCQPINGYMTAWVSDTDGRRLSDDDIYVFIENYSNAYSTNGGVLGVSYIGTRDANVPFIEKSMMNDGQKDDLAQSSDGISPLGVASIVIASLLALLAILGLVAKKARDRKKEKAAAQRREMSIVDAALFMVDDDDEMKEVRDDASKSSVQTEDFTLEPNATFESEDPMDDPGYEVRL